MTEAEKKEIAEFIRKRVLVHSNPKPHGRYIGRVSLDITVHLITFRK